MSLLTLEQAAALEPERAKVLYKKHVNAGLMKAYNVLGFANMDIESAEGVEIRLRGGRTVLDFSSSIGVLGLGHNHPRIIAAERLCHDRKLIDALKVGPLKLQAALAYNLAQILPDPLGVCFFTASGAEAVEAAMKLCEKAQRPSKTQFVTATNAFHGKTHASLSLTRSEGFQDGFILGVPEENVIEIPYGEVDAVQRALEENRQPDGSNSIIAAILEPMQGQGLIEPPPGYLREVAELCRKNRVLVIFDEVKVGMGRTGTFCAFEVDDVVPDVVTLSKALGGGKRAIGAAVTSPDLFQKAYGKRKDWASHTTTFGGLGESCAVAIETLNVFQDEKIVESVRAKGEYLHSRLLALKQKHGEKIAEIRGRGLLQGVRFRFNKLAKSTVDLITDSSAVQIFKTMDAVMMACVIRELYRQHNIITHFAGSDPEVLHVMPPLIVEERHLDHFVESLDRVLSKNVLSLAMGLVKAC